MILRSANPGSLCSFWPLPRMLPHIVVLFSVALPLRGAATAIAASPPKNTRPPQAASTSAGTGKGQGNNGPANAKDQPPESWVRVSEAKLTGGGDSRPTVNANLATALPEIEACAEFAILSKPGAAPTFRAYVEFVVNKAGNVESISGGGVASPLLNCFVNAASGLGRGAKPASNERYTAYFACVNRIPLAGQPQTQQVAQQAGTGATHGSRSLDAGSTPSSRPLAAQARQEQPPPPTVPPQTAKPVAAPKAEEPGFFEKVGHAYMNNLRDEERQRHVAARAAANARIESIWAPAPAGASSRWLGRPVNSSFAVIPGAEGRCLFDGPAPPAVPMSKTKTEVVEIREEQLAAYAASASFFQVGASGSVEKSQKFSFYTARALQLLKFEEVDDTAQMRQAPPGAAYYVHAVYYGRSYEVYIRALESAMKASGKVGIGWFASMSAEQARKQENVQFSIESRGLEATKASLFETTPDKFAEYYRTTGEVTDPVPIMVEYRKIAPTVAPPADPYGKILQ